MGSGLMSEQLYKEWRDEFIVVIKEICTVCDSPQTDKSQLNFEEPLKCPCSCEKIKTIREAAKNIEADLITTDKNNRLI